MLIPSRYWRKHAMKSRKESKISSIITNSQKKLKKLLNENIVDIIIFGSYAKSGMGNDVDVALIVRDKNNLDIFVSGVLTKHVVPLESKTFYSRYGDYFSWFCLLGTLLFLLQAVLWKHKLYCKSTNIDSC